MSLFNKMFGPKPAGAATAEPQGMNFITALSMHVRGELDSAHKGYLAISEHLPDDYLATFFTAAIEAGKGNTGNAAESLRSLSHRMSLEGETISKVVSLDLSALVSEEPFLLTIPAVANVIISFGDILKAEGFVQESAVCFETAVGLVPDRADLLHKFGDTLHDLHLYDYAESVLLEALKFAPNLWGPLYTYAVLLQDLGRDEEAITYYEKAVKFNPDHAKCQNNYGAALLRTNQPEAALTHCNLAAELDPDSPLVKINLGNIYLLMQEYESARTCFTEAISLNSNYAQAYYGLGSVERLSGSDPGRIRELYQKAIELNPSVPEFHHELGNVLASNGNPEALEHFSAAAQLNGNLKNLHKDFGSACFKLGRREEALEHLKVALQQNPDDTEVQEMIARAEDGNPV